MFLDMDIEDWKNSETNTTNQNGLKWTTGVAELDWNSNQNCFTPIPFQPKERSEKFRQRWNGIDYYAH